MKIREMEPGDVPDIIEVLKASLGETYSRKTEQVWKYKHINNPFGQSVVLVAIENGNIIGVRAFMRWNWQLGDQIFSAFRAVDTATHPDHQGKGVFKKLTLKAIDLVKEKGDDFIFNTPNSQSLPGYLKMGWKKVNKLKIRVTAGNPISLLQKKPVNSYIIDVKYSFFEIDSLVKEYNRIHSLSHSLFTLKSPEFLVWRYEQNPLQQYEVRGDKDFYLAGYIKKHKYFRELRITEHIFINDSGLQKSKKEVRDLCKKHSADLLTSSESFQMGLGIKGNFGPVLTLRDLTLEPNLNQYLLDLNHWSYTLGDLELF